MKIIAGFLIVAVVAGLAILPYYRDDLADRPKFRTMRLTRGELLIGPTATGTVEPVEVIDVGAQIVASVKNFGPDLDQPGKTIDYRSRVEKDGVLAQLDDLPHRAELNKAVVNVALAEASLRHCQARQKQTERAFKRATELRGTDSEAEYEKAQAEEEMAQAEVAMAEAKLDQAKVAKKQAEINLGYTVIHAPIDGVVIDRRVNVGQTVVAGMNAPSLFLLAKDLHHLQVCAAVNEADIGDIRVGQPVTFTVDAYRDQNFAGTVSQLRLNASLQQNVVTYAVIVDVENPDGKLLPYMTAKVHFEVARRQDALLVPNQALHWQPTYSQVSPSVRARLTPPKATELKQGATDDNAREGAIPTVDLGSPTLWMLAEDGLVRPVSVQMGLSDGTMTEILGGRVWPNDTVVAGVSQKAELDFVTSFVDKVTGNKK